MEDKKVDTNTIIGFSLIFVIISLTLFLKKPTAEQIEAEKAKNQQLIRAEQSKADAEKNNSQPLVVSTKDSVAQQESISKLGAFAYSASLPSAKEQETILENEVLRLKINNLGGYISEALLKPFQNYSGQPLYLIRDGQNAALNLNFSTTDNRLLHTNQLFFEPTLTTEGQDKLLSMKLKVSKNQFLEYQYRMKPQEYMVGFTIRSHNLKQVMDASQPIGLTWQFEAIRQAKSASYENRYTEIVYEYEDGKDGYTGQSELDETKKNNVTWIGFKQHFFSNILLTDTPFATTTFISKNKAAYNDKEDKDITRTKSFAASMPLQSKEGELHYNMDWYYGPTDYDILQTYNRNLDEIVPLGWGIFGWINRYIFIPFFGFLSSFLPYGISIIVLTLVVRIILSPVTYKSYLSQARAKVLKPEIEALNKKYKNDQMKRQQELMALHSKAGVNPMSGCLPAVLQIPVFYALFNFFPSAFALRQKRFLWAEDLSSYDTIAKLPFEIPFYGDHISLFPILASIAIFIYMQMTTGQSMATTSAQQPGMPNMKFMMYLSPVMMLFFFNNYASGLSLYYFVSNLITIGILLVIKNWIIDEKKIHAKIEESKKNPKKRGKLQQRMQQIMERAQEQQRLQQAEKNKRNS